MDTNIQNKVDQWLNGNYDAETVATIKKLQETNPDELTDAFYRNLEFGTGGLRGIMGVGTNRMNKYTVGMATQGFANYLKKAFSGEVKVAIAHDSRNNARFFAETVANVFAANGIKVFLFESLRPTPELSFAIRYLQCNGGVVLTASHNPKEYSGYKAYWNDGAQLVPPHDVNVIREVEKITTPDDVKWSGGEANITLIGKEIDEAYQNEVVNLSINPDINKKQHDLKIVYTPIHGTGITQVPAVLQKMGFTNVTIVEEQATPDGNFPTVVYPNPEESEAMSLGLKKAKELDADILLGTDPDADRVGIAVKDQKGEWILLNGNQTGVLLFNYIVEQRKAKGLSKPNDFIAKTVVTSDLIDVFAARNEMPCYNVLTGFKWIADMIRRLEPKEHFICGGEESYGYMIGDKVRDKDAISAVAMICEMAAFARNEGKTLFEQLLDIYVRYGYYKESLLSLTKKGMKGAEEIAEMMRGYRDNPPTVINGSEVVTIYDYQLQQIKDIKTGDIKALDLPKSNVLQFLLADGSKISARPSGTEPKIKFYFSVNEPLAQASEFDKVTADLDKKISGIIEDMKLK
ncbi:phosphoglucomutase [Chitinophaga terrae (ex Kim and Jung 2007)]|uniref:Phosphoglucomutase n=1 Tax=Chitinophaga terrae (ex Kim and Jung 2007) TaxID=408074 RepID=A0A1H3YQW3_9BACT|nr:phospho-sugar mutase [Chitinophaga terrae (ex Kim and Jung 2007)]MDQ0107130.1 phosphoglucomutase [Chitinophaga terrae (ex Kim and Jung 2007)]GEP88433.1 phosphoglucomutase [Chitinophaga terrae (ex Kim and Jung 2007)]SEA13412.1 phosphoglucomutase [Chitinophaga terrae (ex Kim and Jung 2007)]